MQQHQNPVKSLEAGLQERLQTELSPAENVLATFPVDLNESLHFAQGQVALTERRLLACMPAGQTSTSSAPWQSWALDGVLVLRQSDHGGVGTIE